MARPVRTSPQTEPLDFPTDQFPSEADAFPSETDASASATPYRRPTIVVVPNSGGCDWFPSEEPELVADRVESAPLQSLFTYKPALARVPAAATPRLAV